MEFTKTKDETFKEVVSGRNIDQRLKMLEIESTERQVEALNHQAEIIQNQGKIQELLSKRILTLNWVLGILTFVGAAAGVIGLLLILTK